MGWWGEGRAACYGVLEPERDAVTEQGDLELGKGRARILNANLANLAVEP